MKALIAWLWRDFVCSIVVVIGTGDVGIIERELLGVAWALFLLGISAGVVVCRADPASQEPELGQRIRASIHVRCAAV